MKTYLCILITTLLGASLLHAQSVKLTDLVYDPGRLDGIDSKLEVQVGDKAPEFSLPSVNRETVSLSDYKDKKNVVLSFVPAAWTPVCSAQWPGYSLSLDYFTDADAVILGLTVDNLPTLYAWTNAMGGIDFPVLSDFYPHGKIAQAYGVLRSNGMSERALFIIDREGIIRYIDVHDINQRPPLEDLIDKLNELKNES